MLLELAVLENDVQAAQRHLAAALASVRRPWQPETTANNLALIRDARQARGLDVAWVDAVNVELQARAAKPPSTSGR